MVEYENLPPHIGAVISAKLATLVECDTVYGVEDIYLMLEVLSVDAHNRRAYQDYQRSKEH